MKRMLMVFSLFLFVCAPMNSKAEEPKLKTEQELAVYLRGLVTCSMNPALERGGISCRLHFRGLELEFLGVNAPGGGTMYVYSLGKNQTLFPRGKHCININFRDEDLIFSDQEGVFGTDIIFRDDGSITHTLKNEEGSRECD